jgi:predicted dehydrogenase
MNTTMDKLHVPLSIPILKQGLDLLLEKPICNNESDLLMLYEQVKKSGRKVMVCHVLRHAPFYKEIKKIILSGEIGEIVNIQAAEHFGFDRMLVAYVRGKWGVEKEGGSPVLLAKCCHDIDMICWLMGDKKPEKVQSFGSLTLFREENAPKGAGTRCLLDCPPEIEQICPFTARYHIEHPEKYKAYAWTEISHIENPTDEDRYNSIKYTHPFGRCAFKCGNDLFDHQTVNIEFQGGSTANFTLTGVTPHDSRTIHIACTKGEISGCLQDGKFTVTKLLPDWKTESYTVDLKTRGYGYESDDHPLLYDFVKLCKGGTPSISATTFEDSVTGHLVCFAADKSLKENRVVFVK